MDYATAKPIVAEHAPTLILDPDTGAAHIIVRKTKAGHPFSIMLPDVAHLQPEGTAAEIAESERKLLLHSLDTALAHL